MLQPTFQKNDKKAYALIGIFSVIVFAIVAALGRMHLNIQTDFNVHIFATINAAINSLVALLLVAALWAVKGRRLLLHKRLMMTAMILSILFLVFYITHHLLSGDTMFGDVNHDGIATAEEKAQAGSIRFLYYLLLITHIILASFILPFILLTAYRGLTAEWPAHRKLAKYTWPLWFYVAITGPLVYWMIRPYYP